MTTELLPHRREQLVCERVVLAGAEAGKKCCAEHVCRHLFLDVEPIRPELPAGLDEVSVLVVDRHSA